MKKPTHQEKILNYMLEFGSITFRKATIDLNINNFTDTISVMRRNPDFEYKIIDYYRFRLLFISGEVHSVNEDVYNYMIKGKDYKECLSYWKVYELENKARNFADKLLNGIKQAEAIDVL
jgi:hypothetical protein